MAQVAKKLDISTDLLWGKLVAVKMLIFDDDHMVADIDNLNRKLEASEDYGAKNGPAP